MTAPVLVWGRDYSRSLWTPLCNSLALAACLPFSDGWVTFGNQWASVGMANWVTAIRESFPHENLFSSNSRKFSPAKETRYTGYSCARRAKCIGRLFVPYTFPNTFRTARARVSRNRVANRRCQQLNAPRDCQIFCLSGRRPLFLCKPN